MTARQLYEGVLIELNKENAPNVLLEDFNYFANKAINQYVNKRYNIYDVNQQTTDDLRVLKASSMLTPKKLNDYNDLSLVTNGMATYYVDLPSDYLHLLNCICIYNVKKTYKCYNKGDTWRAAATRLTADMYSQVLDNFWLKPTYKRPYYYIHNINIQDIVPTNPYAESTALIDDSDKLGGYSDGINGSIIGGTGELADTGLADGLGGLSGYSLVYPFFSPSSNETINSSGGSFNRTIKINGGTSSTQSAYEWAITIGESWVTVSGDRTTGTGPTSVTFNVALNSDNQTRECTISIRSKDGMSRTSLFKVIQYASGTSTVIISGSNNGTDVDFNILGIQSGDTDSAGNVIVQGTRIHTNLPETPYSNIERGLGIRYGNVSKVRLEIRYGTDNSVFSLDEGKIYVDYIKAPLNIRLTQEELDHTEDKSQMLEFPDYVCQEILNELVHIIMENISEPRLQTHPVVSLSIANPAQALAPQAALGLAAQ